MWEMNTNQLSTDWYFSADKWKIEWFFICYAYQHDHMGLFIENPPTSKGQSRYDMTVAINGSLLPHVCWKPAQPGVISI